MARTSETEIGSSHKHATTRVTYWWRATYVVGADHIVATITIPIKARAKVLVVNKARLPFDPIDTNDSMAVRQYVDALIDSTDFATVAAE